VDSGSIGFLREHKLERGKGWYSRVFSSSCPESQRELAVLLMRCLLGTGARISTFVLDFHTTEQLTMDNSDSMYCARTVAETDVAEDVLWVYQEPFGKVL